MHVIMMMLFIIGAEPLVSVFTRNFSSSDASFIRLAVIMLRLASLYTLADITQLVLGGALRGCRRYAVGNDYFCRNTLAACGLLL